MRAESTMFLDDMLTAQHSANLESTFIVLNNTGHQNARWSGVLLHNTSQLFIKAPSLSHYSPATLIELLDMAERMGVAEAVVCVPRASMDCEELVQELLDLDFTPVSPRHGLGNDFILLRFGF